MPAAGRFDWLSDNEVIVFCKQLENKNTKNKTLETYVEKTEKGRLFLNGVRKKIGEKYDCSSITAFIKRI